MVSVRPRPGVAPLTLSPTGERGLTLSGTAGAGGAASSTTRPSVSASYATGASGSLPRRTILSTWYCAPSGASAGFSNVSSSGLLKLGMSGDSSFNTPPTCTSSPKAGGVSAGTVSSAATSTFRRTGWSVAPSGIFTATRPSGSLTVPPPAFTAVRPVAASKYCERSKSTWCPNGSLTLISRRSISVAAICPLMAPWLSAVNDSTTPLPVLMISTRVPGGNVPAGAVTVTCPLASGTEITSLL